LISLVEFLAWLDQCELMLAKDVVGTDPIGEDQALLARLEAALGALDTLKSNTVEACRSERECDLMLSLLGLARVGLEHLLQRYRSSPGMQERRQARRRRCGKRLRRHSAGPIRGCRRSYIKPEPRWFM
jgi:hypothetical protein